MKSSLTPFQTLVAIFSSIIVVACNEQVSKNSVYPHPIPKDIPRSELYQLTVNDHPIEVEELRSNLILDSLPDWFIEPYTSHQQEVHIADFSVGGEINVELTVTVPFDSVVIKPRSRAIEPMIDGQKISFSLTQPDKLYIRIDNLPEFCLFANPLEGEIPNMTSKNVVYFGPGIHKAGYIDLKSNQNIYLAAGAYVYGGIRGKNVSNVKIFGRGVLDGGYKYRRMVLVNNSKNLIFEGITIRNGVGWTNSLDNCDSIRYDGVKVISFGPSGDGINPLGSRYVEIKNCFLRCTDDCIAIKSLNPELTIDDINIFDNTMVGYAFSDGVTIGFETNGPEVKNVKVRNCDILMSRGGSMVDGHSAFSIICDGGTHIHNILYENIRAEEPMVKLFELHVTDGTIYGINPPGKISDVRLKNIHWSTSDPIVLQGFSTEHNIKNVTFESCYIKGEKLSEPTAEIFQIGDFVEGVYFE